MERLQSGSKGAPEGTRVNVLHSALNSAVMAFIVPAMFEL
jgi:hypothetical protein